MQAKLVQFPDLIDRKRLEDVETIAAFDEVVTAPLHGFASAAHYWAASSCRQFLTRIRLPVLLINAVDDPLVPQATLPLQELAQNSSLRAVFTRGGGHAGFVSGESPASPCFWAEKTALAFLEQSLS
jgi:predicted alpha/beta-fold hydrolase